MSETSIEIPDTVRRAVGFELTATKLENFGDEWAVFAQQYRSFSEQIKEQSLSGGMSEELWEETRQALLDERENSSSNWLQIDFFPSVLSDKNSTASSSDAASGVTVNTVDTETHHQPITAVPAINNTTEFRDKDEPDISDTEELADKEESEVQELVDDDPLQQDLVQRAVPILFAALERYGAVSNMGLDIRLEGERNSVTWSILDRKLTVEGEENMEILFDSNKQVESFNSSLSKEYVEHLENQVAPQLEAPKTTRIIDKNISR
ncbi:MAG: hypothetical protein F6K23_35335 [Okeania sp. SIO2C9]|uniref:hypothetical protein n=1 Tax=Okeania sp. SIO2C9 TaxID=2607791 RepID=UPI0013BF5230|nr:hypothetical protein [Okeania sp. SIO2C9]NEQ77832.1 hypothetical protein [Okeania sp. SIO2C9]